MAEMNKQNAANSTSSILNFGHFMIVDLIKSESSNHPIYKSVEYNKEHNKTENCEKLKISLSYVASKVFETFSVNFFYE